MFFASKKKTGTPEKSNTSSRSSSSNNSLAPSPSTSSKHDRTKFHLNLPKPDIIRSFQKSLPVSPHNRPGSSNIDIPSSKSRPGSPSNVSATKGTITDNSSGGPLEPLVSPAYEDVPIWNILPSYQLYESTFSKNLTPTDEDLRYTAPTYETSSSTGTPSPPGPMSQSADYFPMMDASGAPSSSTSSTTGVTPNSVNRAPESGSMPIYDNSILGNTQKIKRLADIGVKTASGLKMEIHVTTDPGAAANDPSADVDVSAYEYHQGDSIHGYILVQNITKEDVNFDMLSVVFEGRLTVMGDSADNKMPVVFFKFLNMFDYNASWTPADFTLGKVFDSRDDTCLAFPVEKTFPPSVVYKKYFSFQLPNRLLDCACETHNLQRHCELVPSIGLARDQFMQSIRKLRQRHMVKQRGGSADISLTPVVSAGTPTAANKKKPMTTETFGERIKDLSFSDTAISYSVEARIVGRASQYNIPPPPGRHDEFIIMEDASCFVRIIPQERLSYEIDPEALDAESRLIYRNLVDRVESKIKLGNELLEKGDSITSRLDRTLSITKRKQLYTSPAGEWGPSSGAAVGDSFSSSVPLRRKQTITSAAKICGIVDLSVPPMYYKVKYVPTFKFQQREQVNSRNRHLTTTLQIPVELTCTSSTDITKPPEIKGVSAEVIAFTYRSKKYPVPIEMTPDLIYKNLPSGQDDFEHHVSNDFKKYLVSITDLTKKLNHEVLGVDSQLIMDIKALADLSCKYHRLNVNKVSVKSDGGLGSWKAEPSASQPDKNSSVKAEHGRSAQFSKTIDVSMDLSTLMTKEVSSSAQDPRKSFFTLVPNFQNCIIGRLYFVDIIIKFHNYDSVHLKVPFSIEG